MLPLCGKLSYVICESKAKYIKISLVVFIMIVLRAQIYGQVPNLGATSDFALFTAAGAFNNTGASTVVTGDVGTNVGLFSAFPPGILIGAIHTADGVTAQAATDVSTAYSNLDGLTCGAVLATTLGSGQTLTPNIYCLGAASTINGPLILDAQGNPNAIFIFQIDGALSTTSLSSVSLINSASLCNVFWQINGAVSLGTNSVFVGTMLVQGAINLASGATLNGRGLSTAGAISLADNVVTTIPSGIPPVASVITASGATTFCIGDSVTLSGNVGGIWNNGLSTPTIVVKITGDYYVVNSNGCGSDTSNHIFVQAIPDNIPPIITCPSNITAQLDPTGCEVDVSFPSATATDNCSEPSDITITSNISSGSSFPIGTTPVTFTATDLAGNTEECTFNVVVVDGQPPVITCPSNITVSLGITGCEVDVLFPAATATDCSAVNITSDIISGSSFSIGTTPVTFTATDLAGNTDECTFNVVVIDSQPPVITCPPNITVSLGTIGCEVVVLFPAATATDCSAVSITSDIPSGSSFSLGTTTVTFTAIDLAGNTDQCTFNVVVVDAQPPLITCPPNVTVQLGPTACEADVTFPPATATDCSNVTISSDILSGSTFQIGTTTVTFSATDVAGNISTCSFNITVNDFINPSLACINVNLSLDEDCEGELSPTEVLTGWEHVSGIPQIGCLDLYEINIEGKNGEDLGNTAGNGQLGKTLHYTITYADIEICWGFVTIEDKIAPTIDCRDIAVNCLTDIQNVALPIVSDNCSGATAILVDEDHEVLDCDPTYVGRITRVWKAVDAFGNESATCTSVIDLLRPSSVGIVPPVASVKISCSEEYTQDDKGFGFPHPSRTGVPRFNGKALYPLSQLSMIYCNAIIDYTDQLVIDTDCKKRILRSWSITEWWCSTAVTLFAGTQIIDIVDEIAPVIPVLQDITLTTQTRSCTASVVLPRLNITDSCNEVYRVYINANDGNPSGYLNSNGGILELGVGTHTITYTAFDNCTNSSSMSYEVTVRDDTDPVAICDQFATVSLKTNGYTEVTAKAVDDGSFDECGEVTLQIRRMEDPCNFGHDTAWYDKVGFCCLDANTTRMVQLLVTDKGGNTNICMVSVNVQEKVDPTITCPGDLTINDCLYTFDPSLAGANAAFGSAIINDNCPANNTLTHNLVDNRNQCGVGTVVRTFSVRQGNTIYGVCTQTITFRNNDPFNGNSIVWPKDYLALGQCSFSGLLPETLPDSSSMPKFVEDACDLVGMRYEDQVFPFTTNGACYKIIRTWTVIDWCQEDINGNNLTWSYEQEIKVIDNVAPVITVPPSPVIFSTVSCYSEEITLAATATDCTPASEIKWNYVITENGNLVRTGNTSTVTDEFEVGDYTITFTAEDRCGNISEAFYDFTVETTKSPTAVCKNGLSAALVLMDTNGDGIGDTKMAVVQPSYFDNKSYHTCGYSFDLSFSSDVNDTIKTFVLADAGCQLIELWVTDENGNTTYCETFVDVQNDGIANNCDGNQLISAVSGRTANENNEEIENVSVDLMGSEQNTVNTDENGRYVFAPMNNGGSYQVVPTKDGDDINGVSTLDLVMIQRHILNLEKLNSPYKLIAADANSSGSVTASDLTELRKLVLGLNSSLPNNTSWRFIDGGYKFIDATNPWAGGLHEQYSIDVLNNNMEVNFVGIKIGDVNGNAKGKNVGAGNVTSRTGQSLKIADRKVMKGEILEIAVMSETTMMMYGMQAQWQTNGLIIRDIKPNGIGFGTENYVISGYNKANMSISLPNGERVIKDKPLFTIEVEAIRTGLLSEMLMFGDELTSETYNEDMEAKDITLNWRADQQGSFAIQTISPNPWQAQTQITFEMPKDGMVTFKIKDYTGRSVVSTIDQYQGGKNTIQVNRTDLGQAGVYVYELRFEDKVLTGKMILID